MGRHSFKTLSLVVYCLDSWQREVSPICSAPALLPFLTYGSQEAPCTEATRAFLAKCLLSSAPEIGHLHNRTEGKWKSQRNNRLLRKKQLLDLVTRPLDSVFSALWSKCDLQRWIERAQWREGGRDWGMLHQVYRLRTKAVSLGPWKPAPWAL